MAGQNKTILLTGATGGLGSEVVPILAKSGFNLALHFYQDEEKAKQLCSFIKGTGVTCNFYRADLTVESQVKEMIRNIEENQGGIDILINNAGISKNAISWKYDLQDWEKVLNINLTAPFLCIKHSLPQMRERNFGRIINISSVVAQTGFPGTASYAASKAGLLGLTKTVARETAGKNITVNAIALGYFNTGMINNVPDDIRESIRNSIPEKRFGRPEELAALINYLSGDQAEYLTGQILNLNGGMI